MELRLIAILDVVIVIHIMFMQKICQKKILVATISNGVKRVHWTGGEPLLNKDICNYMEYAKKLGYEEQVMTTNGLFFRKKGRRFKKSWNY